jgi:carbon-monoxide dehydrogenase large subunit
MEPFVGRAMRRTEDRRFVTGRGCFVGDFTRPGVLHAAIVRSAVAHARVTRLDPAAARAIPGVLAVLTAADLKATGPIPIRLAPLPGFDRFLQPPIADGEVRYVGEPVAVVIADDRYVAEDAAATVRLDYEDRPAVVDAARAGDDRTIIHSAVGTNVAALYTVARGEPERAFAAAEYTRTETFCCHRHTAVPLETRGLVAEWDAAAAKLTLWGATKVTFFNRRALARMLGLPDASVELVEIDVGGSFGVRGEFYPEDFLIPAAAMAIGRPLKWVETRRESFLATNHSREVECELTIAARRDGTILGLRARILADMGAYVRTNGGVVPAKAAQFLPGPYRIDHVACEVRAVLTNKTPVATYRGPGRFEANFFRERLLDLMAADLGLDPVALRRKNLLTPADLPYALGRLVPYEAPSEYDSGDYASALDRALADSDYGRHAKENGALVAGKLHGIGVACFVESSGAGPSETARLVVRDAGAIELYTGCASSGQGHETWMAQIVADELGVDPAAITVFHGTTSFVEGGYGTYHSRAVVVGGSAAKAAARALIAQLVALAAARTGHDADALRYREGVVSRPDGAPVLSLATLAAEATSEAAAALAAVATFSPAKLTYTYGTHVAHVAVDPETGAVDVLRLVTVEDVGRAINPLLVHGQAHGAAVQGLGGAFMEELVYDESGQLLTGTLMDYAMPPASAFPRIDAVTLEEAPSTLNPLGAKGAGEGGIVAVGAAAANAVAAALAPLGVVVRALPLSAPNIARWIRDARAAG